MKKLLIVLAVLLALAGIGVYAYIDLNTEPHHEEIPWSECEAAAVGFWSTADGDHPTIAINANHTGVIQGEDLTWRVTASFKSDGDDDDDSFHLDFMDANGRVKYKCFFGRNHQHDLWICTTVWFTDENDRRDDLDYYARFKDGSVELIPLNADNWSTYFEIKHAPKFSSTGWTYYAYICLKKEYAPRVLETGFQMGLYYDIIAHPYSCTVDLENQTFTLGDIRPDLPEKYLCEPVYLKINTTTPRYLDGALQLEFFTTDVDYWDNSYVYVADDIFIGNANGVLVLAK